MGPPPGIPWVPILGSHGTPLWVPGAHGISFFIKLIEFFEKKLQEEYNLSLFEDNKQIDKIKYEYEIEQTKKTLSKRDKTIFTVSTKEGLL